MNEEEYLNQHFGKRHPFTVPDGYFDNLAERVMQQIPTDAPRKRSLVKTLRPWLYAAACIVLLVGSIVFVSTYRTEESQQLKTANNNNSNEIVVASDNYIDDMADYTMVDNDDIYLYLAADI